MGKVRFYNRLFFVLLTATTFLVSGIASTKTIDEILEELRYDIVFYDEYYSLKFYYVNYLEGGTDFLWENMESEENAKKLSDNQFVDGGKALINLPFGFPFFDLNVTQVAVTKEGTIQSADPSPNWIITPLNAELKMASCNISYLFQENALYVQWNNFRVDHTFFKEYDFSFQVRLSARGEINFVYRKVPYNMMFLQQICDCLKHKFGVIYSYEQVEPFNETYELGYKMDFARTQVVQGTFIRFLIADTCLFKNSCESCTETEYNLTPNQNERCSWCPAIQKCSSKRDSLQGTWRKKNCDYDSVNESYYCNNIDWRINSRFDADLILPWIVCVIVFGALIGIYFRLPRGFIEDFCTSLRERLGENNEPVEPTNQPTRLNNQVGNQNNNLQLEAQEEQEDKNIPNDGENNPTQIKETSV